MLGDYVLVRAWVSACSFGIGQLDLGKQLPLQLTAALGHAAKPSATCRQRASSTGECGDPKCAAVSFRTGCFGIVDYLLLQYPSKYLLKCLP